MSDVSHGPLGRQVAAPEAYDPGVLFAIPRAQTRSSGEHVLGVDIWNAYEVSWLRSDGRPQVALMEMRVPATSHALVESKSLKLYLNSFNGAAFESAERVRDTITRDVAATVGAPVSVTLLPVTEAAAFTPVAAAGRCIDDEPFSASSSGVDPTCLRVVDDESVEETLHSHLLRSLCPVTAQPDWATVIIRYRGARIVASTLLAYVVSFRNHSEFHEQCVERMFADIRRACKTEALAVYARYVRRGGIDINPWRSDTWPAPDNGRLLRQ